MSRCIAGTTAQARLGRAARSVRLCTPTTAVDELDASEGAHPEPTLEIVLHERDRCPDEVLRALMTESLDILRAQPRGPHYVVVATA